MSLTLYMHPLSSFCWKALIGLYESGAPFTPQIVNLGDPDDRAAFLKVSPLGKFPVLRDAKRDQIVPESTIIIEYLAHYYPSASKLLPADFDQALQVRAKDRFFDLYIHDPMQRVVADRLRPPEVKDPTGVATERADPQATPILTRIAAAMTRADRQGAIPRESLAGLSVPTSVGWGRQAWPWTPRPE